jgi:uncharacterized surface protein with fasciclin (FAS1) repeats
MFTRLLKVQLCSLGLLFSGAVLAVEPAGFFTLLTEDSELTAFAQAFQQAGIDQQLDPMTEYTIFAPGDSVVEDATALAADEVLAFHIVEGSFTYDLLLQMATEAAGVTSLATLDGNEIIIEIVDDELLIAGVARITRQDIEAATGYIHVIDAVLEPAAAGAGS